jgi:hypothetical protein
VNFRDEPKNKKVSIHSMYKRRLRKLSRALDQYLQLARAKLDRSQSGNIHNRAEIEHLVSKATELARLLPAQETSAEHPPAGGGFPEVPQQPVSDADRHGTGASEFFEGLTQEEWEEMKRAFNKGA